MTQLFLRLCFTSEELVTTMAKSNWAAASFDVLKQVFGCLPDWCRGYSPHAPKLPLYLLVCKDWVAPARSAVGHLAMKGTNAQLQAVLTNYSGLCSIDLWHWPGLSAESLTSLIHIHHISLDVSVDNISSLESLHTLTHLEELRINYNSLTDEEGVPHLPCTDFSRLTSLEVGTKWQEPPDGFLYLTQLQTLRHLPLSTAAPSNFNHAALSLLTCLHMDNIDLENLETLQELPQLVDLDLLGHPSDAEILMLANLTKLTALLIECLNPEELKCHLSSVVMLSSLVNLKSLQCDLVDGTAHYSVDTMYPPAHARMVVSIPGAPFDFALFG